MARGDRLPGEAPVVRCGVPPFGSPTNLPLRCGHHHGVFGFSVQSAAEASLEHLACWCRNNRVGVLTVEAIRVLGYDVQVTPGDGSHATVVCPLDWSQEAADELAAAFESVMNPAPRKSR